MSSHLTPDEWRAAIERFRYGGEQPLSYREVSRGHLSRAVKDGGVMFGGAAYLYINETDELLRQDVLKWVLRRRAEATKETTK